MIPIYKWSLPETWEKVKPPSFEDDGVWPQVERIVNNVKINGNEALIEYSLLFDGCDLREAGLKVEAEEIEEACNQVTSDLLEAICRAKKNILDFHNLQKPKDWFSQDSDGSLVGQVYRALGRVGVYVPGGTANYPSSVLMTSIPAVVAGVPEIVMVTPPGKDGKIPAATLLAAREAGVTEIYRIGGAQAVAALAYGTETIKPVDKIVGPGNIYVTLAKKMVFGTVGIDMLAGPSEILILGDGSVNPAFAAADLLSQAEHDIRARALLITNNEEWALEVIREAEKQLHKLSRKDIAYKALTEKGAIIIADNMEEAIDAANRIAPEHLELLVREPWNMLKRIKNAGAIFMGAYSPEPLGDYWAGPNHVLPTGGAARFASSLSVDDFYKKSSLINYTYQGLKKASGQIRELAGTEGLIAHGNAIAERFKEA